MNEEEIKELDKQVREVAQKKYLTSKDIDRILKRDNKQTFVDYTKK